MPEVKNIVFENVNVQAKTEHFIHVVTKTQGLYVKNCTPGGDILQEPNAQMPPYLPAEIRM